MAGILKKKIADVMCNAQKSESNHQKYSINLKNLYKEVNPDLFYKCFQECMTLLIDSNHKPSNPYIERAMNFSASVFANIGPSMYEPVFDYVLSFHNVETDHVRYRVCEFVNKLGNNLVDVDLKQELIDKIENVMLARLGDGKADIRLQAVMGLYRLQDPFNKNCSIIAAFLKHMESDTAFKVRRICVEKIAITKTALKALITRTRDTKPEVRLAAFIRLTKFPKHLKISERHAIILNGFYDSSAKVKTYVIHKLIPAWLLEYGNDYLEFFKVMRLDSSEKDLNQTNEVMKFVLDAILKRNKNVFQDFVDMLKVGEERIVPLDHLSIDSVILWTRLTNYLRQSEDSEDLLCSILPDLIVFAEYIKRYEKLHVHTDLEREFILQQLFTIMQGYDLSDTFSCQTLKELIEYFLTELDLSVNVIESLIKNLEKSIPNVNKRHSFVSQIIDDLRYACEAEDILNKEKEVKSKIAEVQVTLDRLRLDQVQVIQDQDFGTAAKNHAVILELEKIIRNMQESLKVKDDVSFNTDPVTLVKCLKIVLAVLRSPQTTILCPILRTFMEELIVVNVTNEVEDQLRLIALECYTLCCLIDRATADKGIQIFCVCLLTNSSADEVDLQLLIIAIKATADLLTFYGSDVMKNCVNIEGFPDISINDVIQALVDLMDHEDIEVEEVATRGLCNMILLERIHSPTLISRMILKWCNPATDEDMSLKQQIGAMLEEFPTLRNASHHLEKSTLITVKTILKAPATSPLSEVNIQDLMKFCLTLCNICEEAPSLNYNLAVNICCEIEDEPCNKDNITLSKMLLMLEICKIQRFMAEDLLHICEEIIGSEIPHVVESNIIKFISQLRKVSYEDVSTESKNDSIEV